MNSKSVSGNFSSPKSYNNSIKTLSSEEQNAVRDLQKVDRQVKSHEQSHASVGGSLITSGPSYNYVTGPDGVKYAVGGEVKIDSSPIPGNPEATISKMQQVIRAALAPSDPSSQDRAVASQARAAESSARAELSNQKKESNKSKSTSFSSNENFSINTQNNNGDNQENTRNKIDDFSKLLMRRYSNYVETGNSLNLIY